MARILPALDFNPLSLQVLVDGKEMGDLQQGVRINLAVIPHVLVSWIVLADRQHLLIGLPLIEHVQYANGAHFHHTAGEAGRIHQHQDIQRIAVEAQCAREESVVAGIMDWGIEITIETKNVQLFVVFELIDPFERNLDYRIHRFRNSFSDGQAQVVRHATSVIEFASIDQALAKRERQRIAPFAPGCRRNADIPRLRDIIGVLVAAADAKKMKAYVHVTLKKTVLDPQGKTIHGALRKMNYKGVDDVRQGKYFELTLRKGLPRHEAQAEVERIAKEVLTNPVIEEFSYSIED
jgi:phosphoribosylformylglycinamidine synthase PurS subunit